ncbi:tRNA (adenosine(37)-N6)-threonylcarbamoyltransferase complex transferase subunit TsaD [Thermogemmatispora carboxidivorans]|uniref:tRNA (adenosine(37)-N6)-threonylcarbamoyltransferase complex transferase subunit TsaD n=1 Tax=Thermogemmatispora carboxidivorans TaxID=1382306 RepID=UPI00069A28D9|nr:tRNA (adenosine(37)-N6)-threonylcarbamoyltransferase complex transferase subunit TsaD [Thermogemmatispora carboxidivorans]
MLVLGIESSCDETGAAIIKDGRYVLANVVASQTEIHERYGGVVPEVASRQQLAAVLPVIETALQQAHCCWEDIDAVAATYGPGLAGSLLVGLTVGKSLALARDLPFLGVNHLEAHIYANWLRLAPDADLQIDASEAESAYLPGDPLFPLICLVVSGAHSELVLMRDHTDYLLLGRTRDDAAGEAFDKVARILGLGYPGGPAIQQAARLAEEELRQQRLPVRNPYRLPRAWLRGTYDFSFSGLKTAMLHLAEGLVADQQPGRPLPSGGRQVSRYTAMGSEAAKRGQVHIGLLAAGFQEAIVDVLAVKTRMAAQEYHVRQVLLAGGVAANVALRARLEEELTPLGVQLQYPPIAFCTDNAAMVAAAAFFHLLRGERHDLDLDVEPNLSLPFRQE